MAKFIKVNAVCNTPNDRRFEEIYINVDAINSFSQPTDIDYWHAKGINALTQICWRGGMAEEHKYVFHSPEEILEMINA